MPPCACNGRLNLRPPFARSSLTGGIGWLVWGAIAPSESPPARFERSGLPGTAGVSPLAAAPERLGEELRLVRREWPTEVGPVDLMCRDREDGWVAVEIKRIGTIEAVEQLSRYLECIRIDPAKAACRGILAAQKLKPQAVALATARGVTCVEVDLDVLRGLQEPELTLFS